MNNEMRIVINAKNNASPVLQRLRGDINRSTDGMSDDLTKVKQAAERMGRSIKRVSLIAGATITGLAVKASKMAFDQVRQVENASFALRAYEKDAGKVSDILGELVQYARSDMGVLFQRQDLFAAASTLKMYGQETDSLVDKVKILSRGVAQGKTTFQELSQIVGRAAAKGRLDAVDFDMLIERGIGLDRSFRGAKVSSEELFEAMEKAIPAEILADRARTIDGRMIRLQSAFRDLGSEILGVDTATSKFIEGGLGDRIVKGMEDLRNVMATPEFKEGVRDVANNLLNIGLYVKDTVLPMVVRLIDFISNNTWVITTLAGAFVSVKTAMMLKGAIQGFTTVMSAAKIAGVASAGSIKGAWVAMSGLITTPIVMPAIAIGAALLAIWKVRDEYNKLQQVIQGVKDAQTTAFKANVDYINNVNKHVREGKFSRAEGDRRIKEVTGMSGSSTFGGSSNKSGFHSGGSVAGGRELIVGEREAEIFRPNTRGRIMPSARDEGMGGQKVTNILSGTFNFNTAESVDAMWQRLDKTQRLARMGMA